jgi:hypothetical protein
MDPQSHRRPTEGDVQELREFVESLQREAAREDLPKNLRQLASKGHERMRDLLEAVVTENDLAIQEIVEGTVDDSRKRRKDGLNQIMPYWARGTALLDELASFVEIDESQTPPSVTVHWELVPRHRRHEVSSLVSMLVDMHQPPPRGGRPRKSSAHKPGHPLTGCASD